MCERNGETRSDAGPCKRRPATGEETRQRMTVCSHPSAAIVHNGVGHRSGAGKQGFPLLTGRCTARSQLFTLSPTTGLRVMDHPVLPERPDPQRIRNNLAVVRQEIADAAAEAGRPPDSVHLVAVTKYVDAETTGWLVEAGQFHLGENRPQNLASKQQSLADRNVHWHLIGNLQRNKARLVIPGCHRIHSIDSLKLLETLDRLSSEAACVTEGLLEINISGDPGKHGLAPADAEGVLAASLELPNVRIRGLMAMSGLESDSRTASQQFQNVARLRDQLDTKFHGRVGLGELSMGMSGDFREAIAAGATWVRVGSRLFC